jgi:hypothetical protein
MINICFAYENLSSLSKNYMSDFACLIQNLLFFFSF